MAAAKMETAAQRYKRIRDEKAKTETLHDVECSDCGMVWKARKTALDFWVTSGILPMHLVDVMAKSADKGKKQDEVVKTMAAREVMQSIEFASKVVRHTAVEPHIADEIEGPNDITPADVLTCCYTRLLNWQMDIGGDEAKRLGNFPG